MSVYTYKGWTITNKNAYEFSARKGDFFTGYYEHGTTGAFLDRLDTQFAGIK